MSRRMYWTARPSVIAKTVRPARIWTGKLSMNTFKLGAARPSTEKHMFTRKLIASSGAEIWMASRKTRPLAAMTSLIDCGSNIALGGKTSKKMAKGAVKLGGTAALAGLAYKAYEAWRSSQSQPAGSDAPPPMKDITPKPEGTPFLPGPSAERDTMSLAILRAMIAAAKADGQIGRAHV